MGVYDRPYYRDESGPGFSFSGWPLVGQLIALNVIVFFANVILRRASGEFLLLEYLAVDTDIWFKPWLWWRLLTYGFVHDPHGIAHILFNMIGLYFFGTSVESQHGRREMLALYLAAMIVAGAAWLLIENVDGAANGTGRLLGASGAVIALMVVYVYHNPQATIMVFGVFPVVAWVFGLVYVLADLYGALQPERGPVAYVAHLGGAAFGWLYCRRGWQLGRYLPLDEASRRRWRPSRWLRRRPNVRLHDPERAERNLSDEVDRILTKISESGEASLTKAERKTLEDASRRYQQRRR